MRRFAFFLLVGAILTGPSTAHALCSYRGELYAETTLEQEYRDARWVVRARVISATGWESREESATVYRLEVVRSFKGSLSGQFSLLTERNSGGFYLDRGTKPDIGGEYLLFLNENPRTASMPAPVKNALVINYSCGQSRHWNEVSQMDRATIAELSGRS
jgi:hypothetical protein